MMSDPFLLIVITSPEVFPGEADYLEGLLEAGLEKLHIRKPARAKGNPVMDDVIEPLLRQLAPRWHSRLVLHGGRDAVGLARSYNIPQVHGHWHKPWVATTGQGVGPEKEGVALSASLHSWEEVREVKPGALAYVFLSPLFDSISKPGYLAGEGLLRRPADVAPCKLIGLGGIDADTIGQVIAHGWDGAALLGYIWQRPEQAVERFKKFQTIAVQYGK